MVDVTTVVYVELAFAFGLIIGSGMGRLALREEERQKLAGKRILRVRLTLLVIALVLIVTLAVIESISWG